MLGEGEGGGGGGSDSDGAFRASASKRGVFRCGQGGIMVSAEGPVHARVSQYW